MSWQIQQKYKTPGDNSMHNLPNQPNTWPLHLQLPVKNGTVPPAIMAEQTLWLTMAVQHHEAARFTKPRKIHSQRPVSATYSSL